MVNVHRTASRYSQPGTPFLLYDTLGLRVAATDGLLSISFIFECFLRIFPGYRGSMRRSGISYPNQHIDSDCFFADLPVFELFSHTIPFDAPLSSSNIDGRTFVFPGKACITKHFTNSLFCKHAAWGAIDSRFPSRPHADDLTEHFLFLTTKAIPFSRSYPSATTSFSSSLCLSVSPHAESSSMTLFSTTEKFPA